MFAAAGCFRSTTPRFERFRTSRPRPASEGPSKSRIAKSKIPKVNPKLEISVTTYYFWSYFLPRSRHNLPEYIGAPYTVYRASKPHSVRVTNSAKIADSRVRVSARRRVRVRVFCEISVTTRLQVEKLIGTRRVLRRRSQIRSQIECAVNIHASVADQREHTGFSWIDIK